MGYRIAKRNYVDKRTGQRCEAGVFHVFFNDHMNRRQDVPAARREADAHAIAGKIGELIRCRLSGETLPTNISRWLQVVPDSMRQRLAKMELIDPRSASADLPLLAHLDGVADAQGVVTEPGFKQALAARGNTETHVTLTTNRVRTILQACGFVFWRDLVKPGAATSVEVYLGGRRTKGEITGASVNYYLRDLKSFLRWLAKTGRAPAMALDSLAPLKNAAADAIQRRSLSVDEMYRLVDYAAAGKTRSGMTGPERALLYRFCFESGMRPGQARTLKVSDFDLTADPPTVTTEARYVKRRRVHVQTLRPALAAELAILFKTKLPTAQALKMPSKWHMADMLRHDLAAARTKWIEQATTDEEREQRQRSDFLADVDHQKQVAVFYSLRHGHGTALAAAGVPEKDIAASMHHASRTTTVRYLHADRKAVSAAIDAMPDLSYSVPAAATGTYASEPIHAVADCIKTASTACTGMASGGESAVATSSTQPLTTAGDCGNNAGNLSSGPLAELADATDSKSVAFTGVSVRLR